MISNKTSGIHLLRRDPTRSSGLVNAFNKEISKVFSSLRESIKKVFKDNPTFNVFNAHTFTTSTSRLKRFRAWLRNQMDSTLKGDKLVQEYVNRAYKQGATRAYRDTTKKDKLLGGDESYHNGKEDQYLSTFLQKPSIVDKVNLLASRCLSELEGITPRMGVRLSRIMVDGLIKGITNAQIAKNMVEEVDIEERRALTIVQTEMSNVLAESTLDVLQEHGVKGVVLEVEWIAKDNACPKCAANANKIYSIEDARGLIPYHPGCYCHWLPIQYDSKGRMVTNVGHGIGSGIPGPIAGLHAKDDKKIIDEYTKQIFGDKHKQIMKNIHELCGVIGNAKVKVRVVVEPVMYNGEVHKVPVVAVNIESDEYKMDRKFYKVNDKKICSNESFKVEKGKGGKGLGLKIFNKQVSNLIVNGFDEIHTNAAGDARDPEYVGYKVWPKFGYNGRLEDHHKEALIQGTSNHSFGNVDTIRDLLSLSGGKEAWDAHGSDIELVFDLKHRSGSRLILSAYAKSKGLVHNAKKDPNKITHGHGIGSGIPGPLPQPTNTVRTGKSKPKISPPITATNELPKPVSTSQPKPEFDLSSLGGNKTKDHFSIQDRIPIKFTGDISASHIQRHLDDMDLIPSHIVKTIKDFGVKVEILNDMNVHKLPSLRELIILHGRDYRYTAGVYHRTPKIVGLCMETESNHESTAIHEMAHAYDHANNDKYSKSLAMSFHHLRLYDKLDPRLKGENKGSFNGKQELFAQGMAEVIKDPDRAERNFDKKFVDYMKQVLRGEL